MQEAFEKHIEKQLLQFKLEPSKEVWQEVEAALHQKKRRVIPIWWMTFAGIILMSGITLFSYFNHDESIVKVITKTSIENKYAKENFIPKNQNKINNQQSKALVAANELSKEDIQQQTKASNEQLVAKIEKQNQESVLKDIQKLQASRFTVEADNNKVKATIDVKDNESSIISTPITEKKLFFQKADLLSIESLVKTNFSNKQIALHNQLQHNIITTNFKKQEAKRKWFITGSAGLLNTKQNGLLDNIAASQDVASSFGNSGSLASNARTTNISYPNGSSYMLGGGFQQTINKNWSYNIALQYKLLSAPLHSIDSLFRVQSSKYKAHWIEIPINFSYQLNNSNHPLYLTAGLSGAYSFASNWSYADLTNNSFRNDKTKNRKLFVNAQIGAVYTIQKNWLMQVSLEKSLTSVHRRVADKFYYTQFNIQIFKFIQSKSKK